ncbi:TonB system biopolymer transport component [Moritella viscosa]|uniref:DUF3450 domain-containing protein n=1 Tax=Moritella viscosa TaxID=80854 RepID=UPI00091CC2B6|nr:DUF3450 domain-containing protein [Moritella viscosa]SGY95623.1 TonB system biopolymer transport component [Moritella viscosa]
MNYSAIWSIGLLTGALIMPAQATSKLDNIIGSKQQSQVQAQRTQEHIADLDDKTSETVNEYRALLRENAVLTAYTTQLEKQVSQQQQLLISLEKNMASVRETRMELTPLMQEMVQVLTLFVEQDIPFLWQERQLRLAELNRLLDNPNISVADKYRRILEAYQIETEYGDTIETWQAQLPLSDADKTVQLIRVGRVALYYLTPDHNNAGYWDNNSRTWLILPASWLPKVKQAYDVADNKTVPTLLSLPLLEASIVPGIVSEIVPANSVSATQQQEAL